MIDIFIPAAGDFKWAPAALYSALTQTYKNKRIILFLDGYSQLARNFIDKWWYNDISRERIFTKTVKWKNLNLSFEESDKGILVVNEKGPSGTAAIARQWLFEWKNKSEWIKMLDSDDLLVPNALEKMEKYCGEDIDGVFCPMIRSSCNRLAKSMSGKPIKGGSGSGSMLLRKSFMEKVVKAGFIWPNKRGHDNDFFQFVKDKNFKFVTTKEDFLYIYLKR